MRTACSVCDAMPQSFRQTRGVCATSIRGRSTLTSGVMVRVVASWRTSGHAVGKRSDATARVTARSLTIGRRWLVARWRHPIGLQKPQTRLWPRPGSRSRVWLLRLFRPALTKRSLHRSQHPIRCAHWIAPVCSESCSPIPDRALVCLHASAACSRARGASRTVAYMDACTCGTSSSSSTP